MEAERMNEKKHVSIEDIMDESQVKLLKEEYLENLQELRGLKELSRIKMDLSREETRSVLSGMRRKLDTYSGEELVKVLEDLKSLAFDSDSSITLRLMAMTLCFKKQKHGLKETLEERIAESLLPLLNNEHPLIRSQAVFMIMDAKLTIFFEEYLLEMEENLVQAFLDQFELLIYYKNRSYSEALFELEGLESPYKRNMYELTKKIKEKARETIYLGLEADNDKSRELAQEIIDNVYETNS